MSTRPTVSIGVPVYNGERYVRQALDSLLAQTYADLEIIVLDNASTDSTEEICRAYQRADRRVRYDRNSVNSGAFANYSAVFRRSGGPLFKWASANDWCAPRFVEACVTALDARPDAVMAYPRAKLFCEDLDAAQPYHDCLDLQQESPLARVMHLLNGIGLNNALNGVIRRSALERTRLHAAYYSSDIVVMAELALLGKVIEVPEYLFFRRMSSQAATKLMSDSETKKYLFGAGRFRFGGTWRLQVSLLSLVMRAGLTVGERLELLLYLVKRLYWEGHKIVGTALR